MYEGIGIALWRNNNNNNRGQSNGKTWIIIFLENSNNSVFDVRKMILGLDNRVKNLFKFQKSLKYL